MTSTSSLHLRTDMTLQKLSDTLLQNMVSKTTTSEKETPLNDSHVESHFTDMKPWVKFLNIGHFQGYNIIFLKTPSCKINGAIEIFQFESSL